MRFGRRNDSRVEIFEVQTSRPRDRIGKPQGTAYATHLLHGDFQHVAEKLVEIGFRREEIQRLDSSICTRCANTSSRPAPATLSVRSVFNSADMITPSWLVSRKRNPLLNTRVDRHHD